MGGGKGGGTQSTRVDPQTAAQRDAAYKAAGIAAETPGIGPDRGTLDAMNNTQGYANFGNQGLLALGGDADAMAKFRTPGGEDILNQMDVNAAQAGRAATNATNQSATRAGAFGGSRAALAQGTAQAGVNAANMNQKAQFQYQQNTDAYNRASGAANLGMGANAALGQYGQYLQQLNQQNDPTYRKYQILHDSLAGMPTGQSTSSTTPWSSVIGGGLMGGLGGYQSSTGG